MIIDAPAPSLEKELKALWLEAFGAEEGAYYDVFAARGYAPERSRCILEDGQLLAALYWLDCSLEGRKLAYLYGVATARAHRGKGLCRRLMADTHSHLASLGYTGAVLVPAQGLSGVYEAQGYRFFGGVREFVCGPALTGQPLCRITAGEYVRLRRERMPARGIVQEGENTALLEAVAQCYAGPDLLLAAAVEGDTLRGLELLGDPGNAPGITGALGCSQGRFRIPGDRPFAMYLPLDGDTSARPEYFGLAFD